MREAADGIPEPAAVISIRTLPVSAASPRSVSSTLGASAIAEEVMPTRSTGARRPQTLCQPSHLQNLHEVLFDDSRQDEILCQPLLAGLQCESKLTLLVVLGRDTDKRRYATHVSSVHRAWRNMARGEFFCCSYQTVNRAPPASSTVDGYPRSPPAPSDERTIGSDQVRP